jgi:glycosyltransferase involved in cell wall biosynthesis
MTGPRDGRLHVLYYYWSLKFDTGSPKVLVSMIDALDRGRVAPYFWADGDGPLVTELVRRDVALLRGPAGEISWRRPVEAARRVAGKVRALRRAGIGLLHINEFGWNHDLAVAAWLLRIPVVLHVHNPLTVDRNNLHHLIANTVLFVSRAHMRQTRHFHRVAARARVLHNPIDVGYYASGRSLRAELGIAEADVVVIGIGQLVPRKGFDVLLGAAERLLPANPRLHFLIVGPEKASHAEYPAELRARAAAPGLGGRFRFLGSRADVPDLLASADIFALPTRDEPFGLVIAEAMAASLPVVATGIGGIPEVLGDSDAGILLDPDDVDGFTETIGRLAASPDERRQRGARGRLRVEREFRPEVFRERLAQVYAEATR